MEFCFDRNVNETVPVAASVATPITVPVNHGEKPERFNGTEFKRWQQKNAVLSHNPEFGKILV